MKRNFFSKIINSKSGFSMAEIVVSAGLLGGLTLGIIHMTKTANKSAKNTETKNEMNMLRSHIHQILLNEESCTNTIKVVGDLSNVPSSELDSIKDRSGAAKFSVFTESNNMIYGSRTVKISSITLKTEYDEGTKSYTSGNLAEKGVVTPLTIEVILEKVSVLTNKAKVIRRFPIHVLTDETTGEVSSCYSQLSNAIDTAKVEFCSSIQGVFNESTDNCDLSGYPTTNGALGATATSVEYINQAIADAVSKAIDSYHESRVKPYLINDRGCPSGQYLSGMKQNGSLDCTTLPQATGTVVNNPPPNQPPIEPLEPQPGDKPCPSGVATAKSADGSNSCQFSWPAGVVGTRYSVGTGATSTNNGTGDIVCESPGGANGWRYAYICPSKRGTVTCNGANLTFYSTDGTNKCVVFFKQKVEGEYQEAKTSGGGWAKGTCVKASGVIGKWDFMSYCPGKVTSCPGGSQTVNSTVVGKPQCACSWNAVNAGTKLSVGCSNGGKAEGLCKADGTWGNVKFTCK